LHITCVDAGATQCAVPHSRLVMHIQFFLKETLLLYHIHTHPVALLVQFYTIYLYSPDTALCW